MRWISKIVLGWIDHLLFQWRIIFAHCLFLIWIVDWTSNVILWLEWGWEARCMYADVWHRQPLWITIIHTAFIYIYRFSTTTSSLECLIKFWRILIIKSFGASIQIILRDNRTVKTWNCIFGLIQTILNWFIGLINNLLLIRL